MVGCISTLQWKPFSLEGNRSDVQANRDHFPVQLTDRLIDFAIESGRSNSDYASQQAVSRNTYRTQDRARYEKKDTTWAP